MALKKRLANQHRRSECSASSSSISGRRLNLRAQLVRLFPAESPPDCARVVCVCELLYSTLRRNPRARFVSPGDIFHVLIWMQPRTSFRRRVGPRRDCEQKERVQVPSFTWPRGLELVPHGFDFERRAPRSQTVPEDDHSVGGGQFSCVFLALFIGSN